MTTAQDSDMRNGLVASILCFMNEELKRDDVTPEKAESLEVATQCLKLAYHIPDLDDVQGPNLLEIYSKAVAQLPHQPAISEEDVKRAEELKKEGNEFMKAEKYDEAIAKYTDAIKLDSKSAVYYCNRAAAHTGQENYEAALTDCKKAVYIDKSYSKAYSRMGYSHLVMMHELYKECAVMEDLDSRTTNQHVTCLVTRPLRYNNLPRISIMQSPLTYSKMERYDSAVECYEKALELDPNNVGYQTNMKIAKDKIQERQASAPGFPGFGGAGGLSDMFNNPMLMDMAQQVMQDPAMQQMAMNMMGNFMGPGNPMQNGGGQQAQGMPDMSQMLRMGQQFAAQVSQQNPELVETLREEMGKDNNQPKDDDQQQS